jgi:hypothetical protein
MCNISQRFDLESGKHEAVFQYNAKYEYDSVGDQEIAMSRIN